MKQGRFPPSAPTENGKIKIDWIVARRLISFWILGLTNNFGYVIMLSSAHDIMKHFDTQDKEITETIKEHFNRECNAISTGAILLANIVPLILVQSIVPFLPLFIHLRVFITIACSIIGFILVALRINKWLVISGVISTSIGIGIGGPSFLAFMPFFKDPNVISTWSSGTGAAGFFGSFAYAGLIACGLSSPTTILTLLISPLTMAICFWILLPHPEIKTNEPTEVPHLGDKISFSHKLKIIPRLVLHYTAPYGLNFLFQYFINQALFELLYFPKTFLDHHDQYRWYQVLYQTGVFMSRSNMNILEINFIWVLAVIQGLNAVILLTEVLEGYMHYLVICMCYIFWEGLIAGTSYVTTYRRIEKEFPADEKEFSMAFNAFGDTLMVTIAGVIALPVHNLLCRTKPVYE